MKFHRFVRGTKWTLNTDSVTPITICGHIGASVLIHFKEVPSSLIPFFLILCFYDASDTAG